MRYLLMIFQRYAATLDFRFDYAADAALLFAGI